MTSRKKFEVKSDLNRFVWDEIEEIVSDESVNNFGYPDILRPNRYEKVQLLPSHRGVKIPKSTPSFPKWLGEEPKDRYGKKEVVEWSGKPAFAEIVILREFEKAGWQGRWIDTYGRKSRIGYWEKESISPLPQNQQVTLDAVREKAGTRGGCFDIVCWRDDRMCFAEAKHKGSDKIRKTQQRWLEAALELGHPLVSFLIVEWSIK